MTKAIQKIVLFAMLISSAGVFAQIKEEKLILDKKREPEVKKIDKKKTSVQKEKNYPPEEKSQVPVNYEITNVPATSDFKTSAIQGEDISPKFNEQYQNNYFQLGYGNYGKFLADGNISTMLENKMEVGADLHYLSTTGLKKEYDWNSKQSEASIGAYLTSYGDIGKFSINADYGFNDYHYYGIYAMEPGSDTDVQQKVNRFKLNGYYDFYANDILNDLRVKSSFLTDKYGAKETQASVLVNLSKHQLNISPQNNVVMNADLGVGLETLKTTFDLVDQNSTNIFNAVVSPKVTFFKGNSYLMLGSDFSFLNSKNSNKVLPEELKNNKFYWFPKAELQVAATNEFKFYAGVDGGLKTNSYSDALQENPYLLSDQLLLPTETKYRFYVGLRGDIDQNIKYDVSGGFAKINNILFFEGNDIFENSTLPPRNPYDYANTFSMAYDHGSVSEVKASVQYFPLANLRLDGELSFAKYKLDHYENIYNKPLLKASLGAKYTMLDKKLNWGAKVIFASNMTTNSFEVKDSAAMPFYYSSTENKNSTVAGFADLNLSAEYKIHKNFSIFALGNNLLNTKYQQFNGYKVLGAQILGGVKITF